MIKRLLIFFLLFSNLFILTFAANDTTTNQEKIEKYNETGNIIYLVLLTLFAIGLIITLFLIQSNYGTKRMLEVIGFVLFISLLFWLFRIA